ncbi:hypothetical protein ACHHYP_05007 [Achlya hypogyna]|uniref:EF-hand domain-containing protein n=1 Tax=Achlya hypogyna TaxID=1202772 RepID=A0A1V9YZ11_ACHHY|nr:hypothetical protein ACHHYP_05007 [Achlya hypogyna]
METQLRFAPNANVATAAAHQVPRSIAFHIPIRKAKAAPLRAKPHVKPSPWAPAKPAPVRRKPAWNDDVHGTALFDQSLAKNQLLKDPKKWREVVPPGKQVTSVYAQSSKAPPRPARVPKPAPTIKKIKTKPQVDSHWSRRPPVVKQTHTLAMEPEPQMTLVAASPVSFPSPIGSVRSVLHAESAGSLAAPRGSPPRSHSPNPAPHREPSPVRRSSNQEDKDDDIAFRSIPPPLGDLTAPSPIQRKLIVSTFKVLDTKRRGALYAREIHQGLQLLGITSTLRQITDYLYLVNDGQGDSIGLSEWVTLVNTLQSAEWLTEDSPLLQDAPSPIQAPSPVRNSPSPQRAPTPTLPPLEIPPVRPPATESFQEAWFIDQIERRINDMFARAEASVAVRWGNQQPTEEPPETFLRRAAVVVQGLKSSLYPLVQQAEETLRAIQSRHASNVSVFLSPKDVAKVMHHSEDLVEMLLDDLLTDTVDVLGQAERGYATQVWREREQDQLQQLLEMIEAVEAAEDAMVETPSPGQSKGSCHLQFDVLMATAVPSTAIETPAQGPLPPAVTIPAPAIPMVSSFFQHPVPGVSMTRVHRLAASLELHRTAFLRSRKLAEATLVDTGFDQPVVIELLQDMLLDDVLDALAEEIDGCFAKLGEKILQTV